MHLFWYHSPIRFYRTENSLEDMKNPQNTQYFGEVGKPYPLEIGQLHRYLIPTTIADTEAADLTVYCGENQLISLCAIDDGKLKYVTFKSENNQCGQLSLRDDEGNILYISNYVRFADSTDDKGRKHIRIISKNYYNRFLYDYEYSKNHAYIVTTIPAYCLGVSDFEVDLANARTGGNATQRIAESYADEIVKYEVLAGGDSNILNFLQVASINNLFFIDGVQKTLTDKIDRDEFSMIGNLSFTNVKHPNGANVTIDETDIFSDIYLQIVEFTPYDNYQNDADSFEGVIKAKFNFPVFESNPSAKVKVYKDGGLFLEKTFDELTIIGNEVIINTGSLDLGEYYVLIENGVFQNALGYVYAGFSDATVWNFTLTEETFVPEVSIKWRDFSNPANGFLTSSYIDIDSLFYSPSNPVIAYYWEKQEGLAWNIFQTGGTSAKPSFSFDSNVYRLRIVLANYNELISNTLTYFRNTLPTTVYFYKSSRRAGSVSGIVQYIDRYGEEQTEILETSYWNDGVFYPAPCTAIEAFQILMTISCEPCTP